MGRSAGCARVWSVAAFTLLISFCPAARADIYEWLASPTYGTGTDRAGWYLPSTTLCIEGWDKDAVPKAPLSYADLRSAYLVGTDLSRATFEYANLTNAAMVNANLANANLYNAMLMGADFTGATIKGADLTSGLNGRGLTKEQLYSTASYASGDLSGTNLTLNDLSGWNLAGKNLSGASFSDSILAGTDFTGATIKGASFLATYRGFTKEQLYSTASHASGDLQGINLACNDLSGWTFAGKNLFSANFRGATLVGADFTGATIAGANFSQTSGLTKEQLYSTASYAGGDLSGISFSSVYGSSDLSGWDFAGKNLSNADFSVAKLTGVDFTGATIAGASFYAADGFTKEQLLSTASYAVGDLHGVNLQFHDLSGVNLAGRNFVEADLRAAILTGVNLAHADLTNATFSGAILTNANLANANAANTSFSSATLAGADFTGATVTGADFSSTTSKGLTKEQLYSTASYASGDLSGISLRGNDLSGWNFAGKNLSNTDLDDANLANANLSGTDFSGVDLTRADLRGAQSFSATGAILFNTIMPDGKVKDLRLDVNRRLTIRNYDGIPVSFEGSATAPGGTLQFVFDGNAWHAPATFGPGVVPSFGTGTLEVQWSADPSFRLSVGERKELELFDWGSVPAGNRRFGNIQLTNAGNVALDSSHLYTDGSVWLVGCYAGDANGDGLVDVGDLGILGANYGKFFVGGMWAMGDFTCDGRVDVGDLGVLGAHYGFVAPVGSVPEPGTLGLLAVGALMLSRGRRG